MKEVNQRSTLAHSTAFKLALYYASVFLLLCAALFYLANLALTRTIQRKQLKAITNKALEYRAWFTKGDIPQLESRMGEQSLQAGDILFVRILGDKVDYINFTPGESEETYPVKELRASNPSAEGTGVLLRGEKWITASVPVGDTGMILQAGKHSQALKDALANFRRTSLLLLIPGGIVALAAGMLIGYRFLSPARQMVSTMEEILADGDLSQRVKAKENRSELNAMVGLFNELLAKNQRLIGVMQDSLDNIAHDLRSPLSRIRMISEQALLEDKQNSDYYRNAIEDSAEEVEYVEELLTVLMDVAEAQSGAMTLNKDTIVTEKLLNAVADLYELLAKEKQITISIECDPALTFRGDQVRLHQSLANLVDNAIKFSRPEKKIVLKAIASNDRLLLTVIDQGIGISEDDLPHIWDRLYRSDRSRTERGMGLGLSLVKAIAHAHKGEANATSMLGKGSTFSLSLPLR